MVKHDGKVIVISLEDNDGQVFQKILEVVSVKSAYASITNENQMYEFSIEPFTRTFTNEKGEIVYLTAKEFDLFYFMFSHKGQVFTKEQLYENVWGYDYVPDAKNLSSFIRKLRKKVEPDPNNPQYIMTVWGVGYKFNEEKP